MWEILENAGIDPAPRRTGPPWSQFLRSHAEAILACDFFTAGLLDGIQAYVLAVIEHATRRIRILGVTLHPTGEWTTQQARNLLMDLGEQAQIKFMIRDRGSNYTVAFDAVLADAGIRTVPVPRSKTRSRRRPDQRISPGRMTLDEVFGTHRQGFLTPQDSSRLAGQGNVAGYGHYCSPRSCSTWKPNLNSSRRYLR